MSYSTEQLLALPDREKRLLAKKLWSSLGENNTTAKEDTQLIIDLDKRWGDIESGKMKLYLKKNFGTLYKKINQNKGKRHNSLCINSYSTL
jgi:hypothetical protein